MKYPLAELEGITVPKLGNESGATGMEGTINGTEVPGIVEGE